MCNDKITAVKKNSEIISVGYGKYCFAIENSKLVKDSNVEDFYKHQSADKLHAYNDAFELCEYALENEMYDEIIGE